MTAKRIKEELKSEDLPNTLYELYKYFIKTGDRVKALKYLDDGINFSKENDIKKSLIDGLDHYINYYLENSEYNKAIDILIKQIEILKSVQMKDRLIKAYMKLGNTYNEIKNEREAILSFNKAYECMKA